MYALLVQTHVKNKTISFIKILIMITLKSVVCNHMKTEFTIEYELLQNMHSLTL